MAICVVDLVYDLGTLFRPETEAFNRNTVDQEEIVADEAYWRPFGAVGQASSEVPAEREVSGLLLVSMKCAIHASGTHLNTRLDSFTAPVSGVNVLCQYWVTSSP